MSRLNSVSIDAAPAAAQALFGQIKQAMGKVPNAYATIGALSPAALGLMLSGDAALGKGTLTKAEIEAIRVAISSDNGCDYCVAAHSLVGKMAGLKPEELSQLRNGGATGDERRDALVRFVRVVSGSRGTVPAEVVQQVLAAGFSEPQVIEALLTVSLITFTNLVNRVNDTTVDFPRPQ